MRERTPMVKALKTCQRPLPHRCLPNPMVGGDWALLAASVTALLPGCLCSRGGCKRAVRKHLHACHSPCCALPCCAADERKARIRAVCPQVM